MNSIIFWENHCLKKQKTWGYKENKGTLGDQEDWRTAHRSLEFVTEKTVSLILSEVFGVSCMWLTSTYK